MSRNSNPTNLPKKSRRREATRGSNRRKLVGHAESGARMAAKVKDIADRIRTREQDEQSSAIADAVARANAALCATMDPAEVAALGAVKPIDRAVFEVNCGIEGIDPDAAWRTP